MNELLEELHKLGMALNANGIIGSDQTCVKSITELTRLQAENERLRGIISIGHSFVGAVMSSQHQLDDKTAEYGDKFMKALNNES